MADAYGKLTGRPGICLVTRGPGATHASVGVHTAFQDSTPMILLVGQVGRRACASARPSRRWTSSGMFAPLAKWAAQIDDAERIPEYVAPRLPGRHLGPAGAGRAGAAGGHAAPIARRRPTPRRTHPSRLTRVPATWRALRELLAGAQRPFVIVGGGGWTEQAAADMQALLPRRTTCRSAARSAARTRSTTSSRVYAGDVGIGPDPRSRRACAEADLLLVVGARLGEMTTGGYTLVVPPRPAQTLIHVHAGAEELGRVYQAELAIHSGSPQIAAALRALEPVDSSAWRARTEQAHADFLDSLRRGPMPGDLDMGEVMAVLRSRLPDDAILTNGAGNFSVWAHRFYEFRRFRTQLAPTSGAMGYGLPGGVAAKLVHPERTVICFAGDGDFLMTGQELATAVQYELPTSSCSWSTTACTGRSACTRSATTRAACPAPTSSIPTSPATPRRSAPSVRWSSGRSSSRAPSSARSPPAARRCSSCASIPRGSRRGRR